jgi:hypothetical protein
VFKVTGGPKPEAQAMAAAMSAYVTDLSLDATPLGRATAQKYGFVLGGEALGSEVASATDAQASAPGLAGGAGYYTVGQLLAAANANASGGWLFLAPADATKRAAVNDLFASITAGGGI